MVVMLHQTKHPVSVRERVLFVGFGHGHTALTAQSQSAPLAGASVMTTHLQALTSAVLRTADPDLVICALMAQSADDSGADVVALIEKLQSLGYGGRIAVLCPYLPRPDLVQAELRALGPGARLTLIAAAD